MTLLKSKMRVPPSVLFALAGALLAAGLHCSKRTHTPDAIVLAKVGHSEISLDDFRLSYEFGLPFLKTGPDRKLSYLQKMIDEKLLSLKGYELHLDKSERVQRLVKNLERELVVEQVFRDNVEGKVNISDEEIRDAINKAAVSWKLRFWWEPTRESAESVCAYMRQHGYAATVEKILSGNPEVNLKPGDFESDYVTWLDVSPELLAQIENLQVGAISDPVEMDGGFYLFQIVDIRRTPVTDDDYLSKAATYRKILRARQENELAGQFIASVMSPLNVVTKGDAFRTLSKGLFDWLNEGNRKADLERALIAGDAVDPAMGEIRKNMEQLLVTFKGGSWSIREFLQQFDPGRIEFREKMDLNEFQSRFNDQVAETVRDHFLLQQGYKNKVDRRPAVRAEIRMWQDKWVYQELRHQLTSDIQVSEAQARDYFARNPNRFRINKGDQPQFSQNSKLAAEYAAHAQELERLNSEVQRLKEQYDVVINRAVLDTVSVIETAKSRNISLQVFKLSSKRMAFPIVDPSWGF